MEGRRCLERKASDWGQALTTAGDIAAREAREEAQRRRPAA
jgi:hypothetical protein